MIPMKFIEKIKIKDLNILRKTKIFGNPKITLISFLQNGEFSLNVSVLTLIASLVLIAFKVSPSGIVLNF